MSDNISGDMNRYQDAAVMRDLLREAKTIAIVGLSSNPARDSHEIGVYLQGHGYRIVPVNPNERAVLGETSYPSLTAIPFPVDIVDVFRRSDAVAPIAEEAVQIGAKAIWLQLGVISQQGASIAEQGGLKVVMDRCIMVEHRRLM
ncbi:MAG: CoA-binding protein [Ktedonobacterales bacterium]